MAEMNFNFDQAFQATDYDSGVVKDCCGIEQRLKDIATTIGEGNASPEWVAEELKKIPDLLPPFIPPDQVPALATHLGALNSKVADAISRDSAFASVGETLKAITAVTEFQIKRAEVGGDPTSRQTEELGKKAIEVKGILDGNRPFGGTSALSEMRVALETAIKQADAANPFFAASFAAKPSVEAPQRAEGVLKTASSEQPQQVATKHSPFVREANVEQRVERAQGKGEVSARAPENLVKRDAFRGGVNVSRNEPTMDRSSAVPVTVQKSDKPLVSPTASTSPLVTITSTKSIRTPLLSAQTASAGKVMPAQVSIRSVQGVAVRSSSTRSSINPNTDRPRGSAGGASPLVTKTQVTSSFRSQVGDVPAGRPVQPAAARQQGNEIRIGSRLAAAVQPQHRVQSSRSPHTSHEIRTAVPRSQSRDGGGRQVGVPKAPLVMRSLSKQSPVRPGKEKGALVTQTGRGIEKGVRALNPMVLRRVATMLAHLRTLSAKELRSIRLDRYDRPADVRVALAIRMRSEKLMERIKALPLKELAKIKGFRSDVAATARRKGEAQLSPREALARREVRMYVRQLEQRLLGYLNGRSPLFKRLTTELTLGDLERLVSIMGGARAVRGLRRKLKSGEVTHLLESDLSNSFLGQLAAAADGSGSAGDSSGGSEDSSPAQQGEGPEASSGANVEESSLIADGATPTATLTTALVKAETSGNSMV